MQNLRNVFLVWAVVCGLALGSSVSASPLLPNAMNGWRNDFVIDNDQIKGDWSDSRQWGGVFCNGSYSYNVNVQGRTDAIDFELESEKAIVVKGKLKDLHFGVDGTFRSDATACITTGGWLGVGSDWVTINARAILGESPQDLQLQILSTEFGTMHLGEWVPVWFEDFAKDLVNRALRHVWQSRVGDWLSKKITEYLKTKIPARP